MHWIAVAYVVATPFAILIELKADRGDCIEERLRIKASDGFRSVSWMFGSGFSVWHMLWAIAIGPVVVGFLAVVLVTVVPVTFVSEFVFGVDLLKSYNEESGERGDGDAGG